jgi:hypothetical protein
MLLAHLLKHVWLRQPDNLVESAIEDVDVDKVLRCQHAEPVPPRALGCILLSLCAVNVILDFLDPSVSTSLELLCAPRL